MSDITTTSGETFTLAEHRDLARLVFKRFGRNAEAAAEAWQRLMENSTSVSEFMDLINVRCPEHDILIDILGYCPDCSESPFSEVRRSLIEIASQIRKGYVKTEAHKRSLRMTAIRAQEALNRLDDSDRYDEGFEAGLDHAGWGGTQ